MYTSAQKPSNSYYLFDQLNSKEQELLHQAAHVRLNAQAPYSQFYVGAAVLTQRGTIYSGCNVERCTFTQTTHAEQNAIDSMIAAEGPSKLQAVAFIAAPASVTVSLPAQEIAQTSDESSAPCGHCLQIIWENCYGDATVKVMTVLASGNIYVASIGQLLPVRFGPQDLGIYYK